MSKNDFENPFITIYDGDNRYIKQDGQPYANKFLATDQSGNLIYRDFNVALISDKVDALEEELTQTNEEVNKKLEVSNVIAGNNIKVDQEEGTNNITISSNVSTENIETLVYEKAMSLTRANTSGDAWTNIFRRTDGVQWAKDPDLKPYFDDLDNYKIECVVTSEQLPIIYDTNAYSGLSNGGAVLFRFSKDNKKASATVYNRSSGIGFIMSGFSTTPTSTSVQLVGLYWKNSESKQYYFIGNTSFNTSSIEDINVVIRVYKTPKVV